MMIWPTCLKGGGGGEREEGLGYICRNTQRGRNENNKQNLGNLFFVFLNVSK